MENPLTLGLAEDRSGVEDDGVELRDAPAGVELLPNQLLHRPGRCVSLWFFSELSQ